MRALFMMALLIPITITAFAQDAAPELAPAVWLPLLQAPVVQPYVTPTPTPPPTPTPTPSPQNVLVNGHFDYQSDPTYSWWQNDSIITSASPGPWDGTHYAHAGRDNNTTHWLRNWWIMPGGYNAVRIVFHWRVKTTEPQPLRYDTAIIYLYSDDPGQMVAELLILDNGDADAGMWHEQRVVVTNMHWWTGWLLSLEVMVETDEVYPSTFDLDGFDIYPINYYGVAAEGETVVTAEVKR